MYYILFKIRVVISPKFENEIAKVYIKYFPTYIFFKKPHFYQISGNNEATEFPESIMQIYAYTISRENCVTSKVEKKTIPEK